MAQWHVINPDLIDSGKALINGIRVMPLSTVSDCNHDGLAEWTGSLISGLFIELLTVRVLEVAVFLIPLNQWTLENISLDFSRTGRHQFSVDR